MFHLWRFVNLETVLQYYTNLHNIAKQFSLSWSFGSLPVNLPPTSISSGMPLQNRKYWTSRWAPNRGGSKPRRWVSRKAGGCFFPWFPPEYFPLPFCCIYINPTPTTIFPQQFP